MEEDGRKAGVSAKQKLCSFEVVRAGRSAGLCGRSIQIKAAVNFPKHSALFEEGQFPDGIILLRGKVKLSVDLKGGRTLILGSTARRSAGKLRPIMSGKPAEFTAETVMQFSFVERKEFLRLIEEHCEL